ncbi:hypothetical protein ROS62_24955 [Streptomyces sp. DSM 41972]|uniref:Lipoprotein n=1 Tax=Streptomyces althioticus subsp. attaecolombicae TaxID=3075534 RepID=A0ABU3I4U6_9ACTN|nr:hypothetical protein [Streptomyces sp. DSM 41972]SCD47116.1 hypothetical protein GA0115245_106514 [Streptomyces sp. di188]SCD52244.1 hypothetical protein GA0115238_113015 [Streptomyces sp. di50b]
MRTEDRRFSYPKRVLTSALLCTLPLTACSSSNEGLSYPTPNNICGIPADEEILATLLDDGDELKQDTGYFSLEEGQFCHLYVDGNDSVVSDADWNEAGYTLRDYFNVSAREGTRYFAGGKYASWKFGVVTVIPCPGVSEKGDAVTIAVKDIRWNEDSQSLLEKLGPPYFDAYKKKLGCPS